MGKTWEKQEEVSEEVWFISKRWVVWDGDSGDKLCNFSSHLRLVTVFPALKLSQNSYVNKKYKHWRLLSIIYNMPERHSSQSTTRQNLKSRKLHKSLFLFNELGKIWKYAVSQYSISQISIFFMNWEKLRSPTKATFENSNFQFPGQLGKLWQ